MTPAQQFPTVRYFCGCYYNQSWDYIYGTQAGLIEALINEDEPKTVLALQRELNEIIALKLDRKTIWDLMGDLQCGGYLNEENPYEQLLEWRDLLAEKLAARRE